MKKIMLAGLLLLSWFAVSAQAVTHHRWPLSFFASPEASRWFDHTSLCGYLCRYDGAGNPGGSGHHGTDISPNGVTTPNVRVGALGNLYYKQDGCVNNDSRPLCVGYGNHVRVLHPDGKVTINAHLQTGTMPSTGNVSCGTIVGIMGNTGTSTAQHLHLEMWSDIYATQRIDHFGGAYSGLVYWVSQNANGYGLPSTVCE